MTTCSLCLKDTRPKCETCGHVGDTPIINRITIWKRKPAVFRKENLDLCAECERRIYAAIKECKAGAT